MQRVMHFPPARLTRYRQRGSGICYQEVTKKFVKPIKFECEKVYCPYLLFNKKNDMPAWYNRELMAVFRQCAVITSGLSKRSLRLAFTKC